MLIQWKNSVEVIKWFTNIPNKSTKCFLSFDIVDYYPSITQKQVHMALDFAKQYTDISTSDIDLILHACKTVLTNKDSMWTKKNGEGLFDVPMGSFHGAEASCVTWLASTCYTNSRRSYLKECSVSIEMMRWFVSSRY